MLKEGDKAPDFELDSDSGQRIALSDFRDRTLVLYFYPRDSTPGCTREAQAFSAARPAIETAGGAIVGVSRDSIKSHCSFREKYDLTIALVSDPDLRVHKAYGAWGNKVMYGKKVEGCIRSTFLVRNGRIARVFPSVKVDGHADAVLAAIGELTASKEAPAKRAPSKKAAPKKAAPKKPAARKTAAKKKASAKKATAKKTKKKTRK